MGFIYIVLGIIGICGTIFNLVRVLRPYVSGGGMGKATGDQGNSTAGAGRDPKPPGWDENWEWRYPAARGNEPR